MKSKSRKYILGLAHLQEGQRSCEVELEAQMFIKFPDLHSIIGLTFSVFKNPEIQVNQTLFFKLKLGTLEPHVEP